MAWTVIYSNNSTNWDSDDDGWSSYYFPFSDITIESGKTYRLTGEYDISVVDESTGDSSTETVQLNTIGTAVNDGNTYVIGNYSIWTNSSDNIGLSIPERTYLSYGMSATLTIEVGEDDPEPSPAKKRNPLNVKEAMRHYISTLEAVDEPATTIKKLTKQALDPEGDDDSIQNARTVAEIWEAAAISRGYEPSEDDTPSGGTAKVGDAVVGTSTVG